ncbi:MULTISPECIES: bifunctional (p)ppGpp synthetase/guanosine-3',5'-bis(diphosphate) 3'-pyrophosphohydrolase [unclassified Thermoactinomyces]|jgi:guanosine-3',5'-bis(diphosphate) 3'-pyrophosphohydrolase|uniref:RelA/SpoT family protein n=1 Tax=unclassified Thermoactinomyces TaxID=2634588 RepID=UPI0018DC54BE|nr:MULTISPECIES: bifunctional (p)ppGpp synthetase/guanosine-3',5'-bis(diphosphate) 3'-pyrophosphohydrolase [unclassified Thermoactinomyces]MBH8597223.1 bifunctional (p)ppGpp synthetase/guanosine-3',5'-bis(diphosphate) 3'-pyrophosphohydrolase [Thermoactinomyces sp. CICC 10523]MBH8602784.1 bifunctional (p)ppGpp synthetase/guanosine-3',5'-bis(diphosphate) 3'-pyrophosphohydrolase [Thermoactinomyces sp. CICC 10522]MBH8606108.1 bifunctional (p)ppGpp synthetase/guanosine-3',5'-bis(diphosphate) 3'-pyrop
MPTEQMPIEQLLNISADYLTHEEVNQLERAYRFAEQAHRGQYRKSGEPYIHHPVQVAEILANLKMDVTTLIAALLHDVVEDTGVTLEQVEAEFGMAVRQLVDGVTKLKKRMRFKSNEEHQAENHRKMFVAMAQDIRVIIIKLADRLHNMRTLKYMPEHKQRQKSKETLEIFAPLAHRLGISKIKWELEDISLRYLNPQQYYRIVNLMKKKRAEREKYLDEIIHTLKERLRDNVNVLDISGRPKHIYSIYRKMVSQNKEFNEIYDLMAVRVIVESIRDCYAVLGIIHTIWKPMPGRFKDYIAMPKANMYQSLHTTVIGPKGEPIEVQIRTMEMHRTAEYGIAAHWAYKEGTTVENSKFEEKLKWFREMMELQQETRDAQEFVESLKMDWFSDSVFVFTPKGDVIELPVGSVPLDFAYRIHTEIGNTCIGAKVNGKIVPLDYQLKTGDIVEILTSKHSYGPSQDWLNIVKSSHARSKIRNWFKKQRREESIAKGREMVEALLRKHDFDVSEVLTTERIEEVTSKFNFHEADDLFAAVGYGGISTAQVVHRLTDGLKEQKPVVLPEVKSLPRHHRKVDHGVRVKGVDNLLIRLSRCCNPVPGDDIDGYVTQGRGVTVHHSDCPNLKSVPEERRIAVEWDSNTSHQYPVDIEVTGFDRQGLLNDVLQVVNNANTQLSAVSAKTNRRGIASIHIRIGIQNINHLQSVVERVKRVRDIYSVRRIIQ